MILVDTSVWIDHFRKPEPGLVEALEAQEVLIHPFVLGELACGEIARRREVLGLLADLPASIVATDGEALALIERHQLMGRGIGYVDVHLIAAARLSVGTRLWTSDKRLQAIASELRVAL